MIKVLAVVTFLAVAQIIPSCGGGPGSSGEPSVDSAAQVIGWVQEKRTRVWESIPHIIVINQLEHGVPYEFFTAVDVGDLVKFDGNKWTIVRKARR
jgi:hypothetical protein